MKTFGKLPDDPFYENINPYLRIWLYESWIHDMELEAQKLKNQAIFIGSFSNPEMAQKIIKQDSPDYKATDSEETANALHEQIVKEESKKNSKKRKRRKVVE